MSKTKYPVIRVLATGVFDILHQEHEQFLRKAKAVGDELWVGVETDVRVKKLKGLDRPHNPLAVRMANIQKLGIADHVFALPEDFSKPEHHRALLQEVKPQVLAVSSHSEHQDKKAALMAEIGGTLVVVHEHNPTISSTLLIKQRGV